jgi:hypothetical protein
MSVHNSAFGGEVAKTYVRLKIDHGVICLATLKIVNVYLGGKFGQINVVVILNVHIDKMATVKI